MHNAWYHLIQHIIHNNLSLFPSLEHQFIQYQSYEYSIFLFIIPICLSIMFRLFILKLYIKLFLYPSYQPIPIYHTNLFLSVIFCFLFLIIISNFSFPPYLPYKFPFWLVFSELCLLSHMAVSIRHKIMPLIPACFYNFSSQIRWLHLSIFPNWFYIIPLIIIPFCLYPS